jgi:hypothetical protein
MYRGRRDAGFAQGFASGSEIMLSKREQETREKDLAFRQKLAAAGAKVQEAEEARAAERHSLNMDTDRSQEGRSAEMHDFNLRTLGAREGRSVEAHAMDVEDRATANSRRRSLDKANEFLGGESLDDVATMFPELRGEIDTAQAEIDADFSGPGEEMARGLASLNRASQIKERATEMHKKRVLEQSADGLATGAFGDGTGATDEGYAQAVQSIQENVRNGVLPPAQAAKALKDMKLERAKRQATVLRKQRGVQSFNQIVDTSRIQPGSDEDQEAQNIIGLYQSEELTFGQARTMIDKLANPTVEKADGGGARDQIALFKELMAPGIDGETPNRQEMWAEAGKMLGIGQKPPMEARNAGPANLMNDERAQFAMKLKERGLAPAVAKAMYDQRFGGNNHTARKPAAEPEPESDGQPPTSGRPKGLGGPSKPSEDDVGYAKLRQHRISQGDDPAKWPAQQAQRPAPAKKPAPEPEPVDDGFAAKADRYLRNLSKAETTEYRRLKRDGTSAERAAWLAEMKSKHGR